MGIQKTFSTNMRRFRKEAHLSQEKLAELAGLHRTYIGGIEQRRINVSLKNVEKIADALGVDPAALFLDNDAIKDGAGKTRRTGAIPAGPRTAAAREDAAEQDPPEYALVAWRGGHMDVRPLHVAHEDLTVQVLCSLIARGHRGDELAKRYDEVSREIESLFAT